jgi:hypothetical protein
MCIVYVTYFWNKHFNLFMCQYGVSGASTWGSFNPCGPLAIMCALPEGLCRLCWFG